MLVNFCTAKFQPVFECSQMQLDGYHAENLAKDFSQNHGFLADSLQRPPIDIYIRFPLNIDIKHIYLGPSIGHHRSTLIEFCVNHQMIDEKTSWLVDSSNKSNLVNVKQLSFHRIAQILNENENTQRIEIYDHETEQSNSNTFAYRFSANTHLINCSTIKLTIKRAWRVSSCALKYLQIWGSLSNSIPAEFKTKLEQILFPTPAKPLEINEATCSKTSEEIPSDFLDALTSDLMLIPMLLPSGHIIDQTTLEKCIAEDTRWCRLPRDPFTLKSFTEITQPVVAQQLKMRIDQFLSEHQNDPKYRQYGRVLDPRPTIPDMFKFNFNIEEDQDTQNKKSDEDEQFGALNQDFGYIRIDDLPNESDEDTEKMRQRFESYRSDLVPNVYEGGFKTWECSYDLVDYLQSIGDNLRDRKTVIELGCGSGLPGTALNKSGEFQVDFQDFNREVIEQTGKQLKKDKRSYNNRMFFGDWGDLLNIIPAHYYDVILTSETIYNTGNYAKLVELLNHALTSNGVIYLAAKVYYFGVQGGVRQFEEFIAKTGLFKTRVVRVIDANVKREILEMTRSIH
ncbi:unnamed protein product [Adineta ricciae]|uniref:U-box domain-containing protein n=1 Tax=Adineta ricciae TaxID=249248 RepID=A0A814GK96_ADIRI|nr:unnamed protein product [Adineta ricciae]CAF1130298.1 unnamed protein product [Adineta ricciae]